MGGGGTMRAGHPSILYKSPSSSSSNNPSFPVSASSHSTNPRAPSSVSFSGTCSRVVFGVVPSQFEIEKAIAALQRFMQGISSSDSPRTFLSSGFSRVRHAFHLLQTEPSIKRLVISLSSDRALWEAITNNESVRNLHESLYTENRRPRVSDKGAAEEAAFAEFVSNSLLWLIDIMKDKIFQLVEKFKSLVDETFKDQSNSMETSAELEEKLRSSLLLSVVILLVVVLARVQG